MLGDAIASKNTLKWHICISPLQTDAWPVKTSNRSALDTWWQPTRSTLSPIATCWCMTLFDCSTNLWFVWSTWQKLSEYSLNSAPPIPFSFWLIFGEQLNSFGSKCLKAPFSFLSFLWFQGWHILFCFSLVFPLDYSSRRYCPKTPPGFRGRSEEREVVEKKNKKTLPFELHKTGFVQ